MMGLREDRTRWGISTSALLVANATPLVGIFFLHWHVFPLLVLYWIENLIVGVFSVLRMIVAKPAAGGFKWAELGLIPAFCLHYGFFNFVYGLFIFGVVGRFYGESRIVMGTPIEVAAHAAVAIPRLGLGLAVISLVVSHAVSFLVNFIQGGEYRRVSARQLFFRPYRRVVVLHMAILGGTWFAFANRSPAYLMVALVVAKTAVDLWMFVRERRKLAGPRLPQVTEAHAAEPGA